MRPVIFFAGLLRVQGSWWPRVLAHGTQKTMTTMRIDDSSNHVHHNEAAQIDYQMEDYPVQDKLAVSFPEGQSSGKHKVQIASA